MVALMSRSPPQVLPVEKNGGGAVDMMMDKMDETGQRRLLKDVVTPADSHELVVERGAFVPPPLDLTRASLDDVEPPPLLKLEDITPPPRHPGPSVKPEEPPIKPEPAPMPPGGMMPPGGGMPPFGRM